MVCMRARTVAEINVGKRNLPLADDEMISGDCSN